LDALGGVALGWSVAGAVHLVFGGGRSGATTTEPG